VIEHARARFHSRVTVVRDTDSESATSCSDRPPKYRSSTIWPWARVHRRELGQCSIEHDNVQPWRFRCSNPVVEVNAHRGVRTLGGSTLPCIVDENPSHHLRGHGVEVPTVLPGHTVLTCQSHEGLVHERRRLQCVIQTFVSQVAGGSPPQLVVHERGQFVACPEIATGPGVQQPAHLTCALAHIVLTRNATLYPQTQTRRGRIRGCRRMTPVPALP
jgi:hypothetical protein